MKDILEKYISEVYEGGIDEAYTYDEVKDILERFAKDLLMDIDNMIAANEDAICRHVYPSQYVRDLIEQIT